MENEKTIEERYRELIELVPQNIREEFERIERGEIVPQMFSDRGAKKILDPDVHPDRLSRVLELIYHEDMFTHQMLLCFSIRLWRVKRNSIWIFQKYL